jgi:hypothetical protein
MKTLIKVPTWFCETHLRAIEDLMEQGENTEAREMTAIYRNEYLLCSDCRNLRKAGA